MLVYSLYLYVISIDAYGFDMVGILPEIEHQVRLFLKHDTERFSGFHRNVGGCGELEKELITQVPNLRTAGKGEGVGNARFRRRAACGGEPQQDQGQAQISNPVHMMTPETIRSIRQKPMISFALSLAMASAGIAQKGWMRLVQASPQAMAMPVRPGSTPRSAPAVNMMGA